MGDQCVDIVMIAMEARRLRSESLSFVSVDKLRQSAIRGFGETEYQRGRFKTLDSAIKTLHDACVRRLSPEVGSVGEFDGFLGEWLSGKSNRLAMVLVRHARTEAHRELIRTFFEQQPNP
jgi:hypothetical protein